MKPTKFSHCGPFPYTPPSLACLPEQPRQRAPVISHLLNDRNWPAASEFLTVRWFLHFDGLILSQMASYVVDVGNKRQNRELYGWFGIHSGARIILNSPFKSCMDFLCWRRRERRRKEKPPCRLCHTRRERWRDKRTNEKPSCMLCHIRTYSNIYWRLRLV